MFTKLKNQEKYDAKRLNLTAILLSSSKDAEKALRIYRLYSANDYGLNKDEIKVIIKDIIFVGTLVTPNLAFTSEMRKQLKDYMT